MTGIPDRPTVRLDELPWWRPPVVRAAERPHADDVPLGVFARQPIAAFEEQGHTVVGSSHGDVDLLLIVTHVPTVPQSLRERVPEESPPLSARICGELGLRVGPRRPSRPVGVRRSDMGSRRPTHGPAHPRRPARPRGSQ